MSATTTQTYTYTTVDIEKVVRRFGADILMIAQSTGAITEAKAREYAHDVEALAKRGYLLRADVTLLDGTREVKAATYEVNTSAGDLTTSRPGGVMWPRMPLGHLRIVLHYTADYDDAATEEMKRVLQIHWSPTNADTSHATLTRQSGRDYVSNGYGLQRTDFQ